MIYLTTFYIQVIYMTTFILPFVLDPLTTTGSRTYNYMFLMHTDKSHGRYIVTT